MTQARILVVDDTPHNVKLLADLLGARGYTVVTASSGAEALQRLAEEPADLVLLDVVMPGMSGYDVCRAIRAGEATRLLPVVMVTALDPGEERVKGIEAGADDFLAKPIHTAELLARVRSLLRIRELHETVREQAEQLAQWNITLERRVSEQIAELRRLERFRGFFSPQVAELIASDCDDRLDPHRRAVTVVFLDLRGFTEFVEACEPEEMMQLLREYHAEMGRLVLEHEGTLERFTGDGLMVFFNDPVEVEAPELRAVTMALRMRDRATELLARWKRLGHELGLGIGITSGYATLGLIGFEGRWDYAALGSVTNQASRLCDAARHGQVLVSDRVLVAIESQVHAEPIGELELKGVRRPLRVHNVLSLRHGAGTVGK